jgi:GntR family transcriptional regulator of arabinose operon
MLTNLAVDTSDPKPIYMQLVEQLRQRILSGELSCGFKFPPTAELAVQLNVNRLTLRKSLQVLEEQHFLVQLHGRGTFVTFRNPQKNYKIGMVVSKKLPIDRLTYDPYLNQVLLGIASLAVEYPLLSISTLAISLTDSASDIQQKLSSCDGIIIPGGTYEKIDLLLANKIPMHPMVFLGSHSQKILDEGHISIDLISDSLEIALKYLLELGHRRIAYCGPDLATYHFRERNASFLKLQKKYQLPAPPEYVYIWHGNFFRYPRDYCLRLMNSSQAPTAIISGSMASGLLQGALSMGLKVPGELSIIGYDGPQDGIITKLEQPVFKMARQAGKLLLNILNTGKIPSKRKYLFTPQLKIYATSGAPANLMDNESGCISSPKQT